VRLSIFFVLLAFTGCAHPISENMRASLDSSVSVSGLFESPDTYIGKRVMLGGNIIQTRNFPDKSEIEVMQRPMDSYGNLDTGDATLGRFIFRRPGYLESEVYARGRDIIGAGVIVGGQSGRIGDRDYLFPVIEPQELNLLPEYPDIPYYPYYYYDPFYPYYYGFPYRHHRHRHHYW
jgi:outer membrane lipoprotein